MYLHHHNSPTALAKMPFQHYVLCASVVHFQGPSFMRCCRAYLSVSQASCLGQHHLATESASFFVPYTVFFLLCFFLLLIHFIPHASLLLLQCSLHTVLQVPSALPSQILDLCSLSGHCCFVVLLTDPTEVDINNSQKVRFPIRPALYAYFVFLYTRVLSLYYHCVLTLILIKKPFTYLLKRQPRAFAEFVEFRLVFFVVTCSHGRPGGRIEGRHLYSMLIARYWLTYKQERSDLCGRPC